MCKLFLQIREVVIRDFLEIRIVATCSLLTAVCTRTPVMVSRIFFTLQLSCNCTVNFLPPGIYVAEGIMNIITKQEAHYCTTDVDVVVARI